MGTATLVFAGLQGLMGMGQAMSKSSQIAAQEAAGVYKNQLSIARTRMMNQYRQRAHERHDARVREHMVENLKTATS